MQLYRSFAARLRALTAAPTFEDEERTHLARLLNALLWGFMAAELTASAILFGRSEWRNGAATLLAALICLGLTRLLHAGHLRLTINLHLDFTVALVAYLVVIGKGIHDIVTLAYPCLILVGSLLLDKKRFAILTGLCLLSTAFLVYAEVSGLIVTPFRPYTEYSDLLILWIFLLIMAGISWLLAGDVRDSLQLARQNERRLSEVNRQLEAQADSLQRSEARWRSLVENAPDLILNITQDGTILFTNAVDKIRAAAGDSIYDLLTPEQQDQARKIIAQIWQTGQSDTLEIAYLRGNQARGWYSARLSPIFKGEQVISVMAIITDLTERRTAEEEIRSLNATLEERVALRTRELQAKNRELETLTYSVSHDLKAPLRGIDGYARLLLDDHGQRLDGEARQFLITIRQATQHMNQLINDLLEYSHLEQRPIRTSRVSLSALAQEVAQERSEEIEARQIDLRFNIPDVWAMAEPDGLRQALRNLLDNALKFLPDQPGGQIELSGKETEQSYIMWVKDNGMGFDMQYHDRIFEIFQRLNRAEQFSGTGIGLALVSKVMQRIGGRAWATSIPGAGATFYLEIPK